MLNDTVTEFLKAPPKVGDFQKISDAEFQKCLSNMENSKAAALREIYDNKFDEFKPSRSTTGSAGYDFVAWDDVVIPPNDSVVIPTYLKCQIKPTYMLCIYPRSGMGFKYGVHLANTIGVIDSDYYGCESNDGHIMVKLTNPLNQPIEIHRGDKFCQGIFIPFGITYDDSPQSERRHGGIGSTGK